MIAQAFRSAILQDPDVSAIVGTQVFTDNIPQGVSGESIVFFVISEVAEDCLPGEPMGFDQARIQCESTSDRGRLQASDLRLKVRKALTGFQGVVDGVQLQISQASGGYFFYDRAESGTDQHRFREIQDFFVYYHSLEKVS